MCSTTGLPAPTTHSCSFSPPRYTLLKRVWLHPLCRHQVAKDSIKTSSHQPSRACCPFHQYIHRGLKSLNHSGSPQNSLYSPTLNKSRSSLLRAKYEHIPRTVWVLGQGGSSLAFIKDQQTAENGLGMKLEHPHLQEVGATNQGTHSHYSEPILPVTVQVGRGGIRTFYDQL